MGAEDINRDFERLPPEFRLAVACCVWPAGEKRRRRIAAALSDTLDWEVFLRVAKRHRIQALAFQGIAGHAPPEVVETLKRSTAGQVQSDLGLAGETVRLTRLLTGAGIPTACLKGASLSMLAFGNLALRHSRDIDLLVDPGKALEADALLQSAGYEITMPKGPHNAVQKRRWMERRKHMEYRHSSSGKQLELHWRLFDNPLLSDGRAALSECVQVGMAGGLTVPTLDRRSLLLYLCVHGANHMWSRLKWITDLAALLAQNPGDVQQLLDDAEQCDCIRAVAQALLLSRGLFATPDVSCRIPADRATWRLVRTALEAMTQGDGAVPLEDVPFGTSRVALARYRLKKDWKFRLREARLALDDELDRHDTGLPQGLNFLMPLLRLPLWLSRRLRHGGRSSRLEPGEGMDRASRRRSKEETRLP